MNSSFTTSRHGHQNTHGTSSIYNSIIGLGKFFEHKKVAKFENMFSHLIETILLSTHRIYG